MAMTHDLIKDAEEYCEQAGITPATLAVRVLNNSRFFDRLMKRIQRDEESERKLRDFMAENPPDRVSRVSNGSAA